MVGNLKVMAVELLKYALFVMAAIIGICLFLWAGWVLTVLYWLDWNGIRLPMIFMFWLVISGGAVIWLERRRTR